MLNLPGSFNQRWRLEEELGSGGQGKVYRATFAPSAEAKLLNEFADGVRLASSTMRNHHVEGTDKIANALKGLIPHFSDERRGALKVLHDPKDARDPKRARERAVREIATMARNYHPSLLKILDSSTDELWYVSEYHSKGTLDEHLNEYAGNLIKSLLEIRPIVEGLAILHENAIIHRDIKPANIFVGSDNSLVLGDFGLVLLNDADATRISDTLGNVGSRDWMPGWAMSKRVDELRPSFDVFSIGKVLWSLISGQSVLTLWYYDREDANVERFHPQAPFMEIANGLFAKTIVEHERDCLPTAQDLLAEIDSILQTCTAHDPFVYRGSRSCMMCNAGQYIPIASTPRESACIFFACNRCGHLAAFSSIQATPPLHDFAGEILVARPEHKAFLNEILKLEYDLGVIWDFERGTKPFDYDRARLYLDAFVGKLEQIVREHEKQLPAPIRQTSQRVAKEWKSICLGLGSKQPSVQDRDVMGGLNELKSLIALQAKLNG